MKGPGVREHTCVVLMRRFCVGEKCSSHRVQKKLGKARRGKEQDREREGGQRSGKKEWIAGRGRDQEGGEDDKRNGKGEKSRKKGKRGGTSRFTDSGRYP